MKAEEYLNRIENKGIGDTFTYSRKEMIVFAEKYFEHRVNEISDAHNKFYNVAYSLLEKAESGDFHVLNEAFELVDKLLNK